MRIGTKSVLFGAHQFLIHPWFVAWAWKKLYGFPTSIQLWVAFFVHDVGYIGKRDMDGAEGETHVELGAKIMGFLFGSYWADFTRYHSRFYAKRDGRHYSQLCVADKLAITLTPAWLYLPMARATGEIYEYMGRAKDAGVEGSKYVSMNVYSADQLQWYRNIQDYLRRWAWEHKDGKHDTWTPEAQKGVEP